MTHVTPAISVVLAGGGTAGHVSPLLALADCLRRRDPDCRIVALGTATGLEARLVPERGYAMSVVPRVPFPRRPSVELLRLPGALAAAVRTAGCAIEAAGADVVVGFGGYVSTPAYLAARRAGVPIVVHEQNRRPGLANRLGARLTSHVAVTFPGTPLPHAQVLGMPLRREITTLNRAIQRGSGRAAFGLDGGRTTLLVTGGSLGAERLNTSVGACATDFAAAGVQVLHITGAGKAVRPLVVATPDAAVAGPVPPYVTTEYVARMDLALAAADLVLCRAGASTVAEITAVGLPAVYVPLPVGNGEQRMNAEPVVEAGGGLLVEDAACTPQWIRDRLLPLLADGRRLAEIAAAAGAFGHRDADVALAEMVHRAAGRNK